MSLPERLMKLRKAANLSQEEVADKLEVSRQTVSKWETGQSSPDLDKVLPLCELYNVTPDELLHNGGMEESGELFIDKEQRQQYAQDKERGKKKLLGILGGSLIYVVGIVFIMVAIPVLRWNPVVSAAIMLLLFAIATVIIIYSSLAYRKEKQPRELTKEEKIYKRVNGVLDASCLAIYLIISFMTGAWHITWLIWIINLVLNEIAKLIIDIVLKKGEGNE